MRNDVSAFVLAGGQSTRMGRDKATIELGGRTLLERACATARALTPYVAIVRANAEMNGTVTVGALGLFGVIADVFADRGPLGGIHAALFNSQTDLNLILAVDVPLVAPAFLEHLLARAAATTALVVVPRCAVPEEPATQRLHPLCAVYRRDFAKAAERALRAGRNKVDRVFDEVETLVIEQSEIEQLGFSCAIFRNLNTPADVERAAREFAALRP